MRNRIRIIAVVEVVMGKLKLGRKKGSPEYRPEDPLGQPPRDQLRRYPPDLIKRPFGKRGAAPY